MSAASAQADDFAHRVAAAQQELAESIIRSGLQRDAYRHVIEALGLVLGRFPELIDRLEGTRRPLSDDDMRRFSRETALKVEAQVQRAVKVRGWRNVLGGVALACGVAAVAFYGGAWWEADRMGQRVLVAEDSARDIYNRSVAVNDGFGTKLTVGAADIWLQIIRLNPGADLSPCIAAKAMAPQGQKCALTLWAQLPVPSPTKQVAREGKL